jgi:hypothetical protein
MTKIISIVSKNLIILELADTRDLESFVRIFTVLDKHVVAETLSAEEARIEYKQYDGIL